MNSKGIRRTRPSRFRLRYKRQATGRSGSETKPDSADEHDVGRLLDEAKPEQVLDLELIDFLRPSSQFTEKEGSRDLHGEQGEVEDAVVLCHDRHRQHVRKRGTVARIIRAASGSDIVPSGFPVVVSETLRIIEPAFQYLLEIATLRGRTASPLTVQAYAEQLLDWFDSLEQSEIEWRRATKETLAKYRRRHINAPSPVTGHPYAPATINGRIRTVCRFYKWAAEAGWIESTPFPTEVYRNLHAGKGFLAHTKPPGRHPERSLLTVTEHRARRRALMTKEVRCLIDALTEPFRTMAVWALTTGMRRMELCGLTMGQIPEAMALRARDGQLVEIQLTVTKGQRPRRVYAPLELIDRTHRYIEGPRAKAAKGRRSKAREPLFLGVRGAPVTHDRASKAFRKAYVQARVQGDLHCLRHTFAVRTYNILTKRVRAGESINVMMVLRDLLGHSSVAVTEKYLESIEVVPEEIEPALTYLYGSVIGEEGTNRSGSTQ